MAAPDAATTPEDQGLTIQVLGNDSDPDGDRLVVIGSDAESARGGTVNCGDVSCAYAPAANAWGPDTFSYEITDGRGGRATALVTIEVTPVNDAPVALDDTASTQVDALVVISVLANDSDPEGSQRVVSGHDATSAAGGTVDCSTVCVYVPPAGFIGTDSFAYTVADPEGLTDTATVTVTVGP